MAGNKTKIDRLHDLIPKVFKTRSNPNWKAIIEALGEQDQQLTDLIREVRKQFFIQTASRPYIDRLGANVGVSRPQQVGMDDATMRKFIPVLAYQPKQVKLILDQLLDIFFFRESTSAFSQSELFEPFTLKDGWQLVYLVDGIHEEVITFNSSDFTDISNATAGEIAGAINRQAEYSFAIVFEDRVNKRKFVRLFTNTVGAKGSIQITGGLANTGLQFVGFNSESGSQSDTVWQITKVGDTVTFTHIGGTSPNLSEVTIGDVALIDVPGNEGSFVIEQVDLSSSLFTFRNVFATEGTHNHSLYPDSSVRFMTPEKFLVYTKDSRAVVWETRPGQVIVEMPATPPVVRRSLKGSSHVNGVISTISDIVDKNTIELSNADDFPLNGGTFVLQPICEIKSHILTDTEDSETSLEFNTRFDKQSFMFSYKSKIDNQLTGVTPDLPTESGIFETNIDTMVRSGSQLTVNTSTAHGFSVGESVRIQQGQSALSTVGIRVDVSATDTATAVATKTAEAISLLPGFSAISAFDTVTVTTTSNNVVVDASDVDVGVSIVVTQQGSLAQPEITEITCPNSSSFDVAGYAKRWNINDADGNQYHVWYVVQDGSNTQLNPGMDDLPNETYEITEVLSDTSFTVTSFGESGNAVGGIARVERIGITDGSLVYLTSANLNTGILGSYVWDTSAAFVLSSLTSNIQQTIRQGTNARTVEITSVNNIPNEEGFVIFDYGTENQEGPVRYLYKPNDSSIQMDPSYFFKNTHSAGTAITVIRKRGPHILSANGSEYAPYVTDPSVAREILQDLMRQVKSVGIFMDFLIRYPDQLYATLDVYSSGSDLLYPISGEG